MQEVVDECGEFSLRPNAQHAPGERLAAAMEDMEIAVKFGQVYLSKPTMTEADGETAILFPKDARLRNLTYAAPLYVDVTKTVRRPKEQQRGGGGGGGGGSDGDEDDKDGQGGEAAGGLDVEVEEYPKVFMGEVPIMLRSDFCALSGLGSSDLSTLGECPLDQGGYFVVNGSEKVLIAQERMAHNHVYVFRKPSPKYAFASECRSAPEGATRALSACAVRMLSKGGVGGAGGGVGAVLRAGLPYVKSDVPIMVVFRALGLTNDKEVLEHIVYDLGGDPEMLDALRPSIEEAFPVQSQETALDYIGKRAAAAGVARAERIAFARDILSRELLPHVGQGPAAETKKVKKKKKRKAWWGILTRSRFFLSLPWCRFSRFFNNPSFFLSNSSPSPPPIHNDNDRPTSSATWPTASSSSPWAAATRTTATTTPTSASTSAGPCSRASSASSSASSSRTRAPRSSAPPTAGATSTCPRRSTRTRSRAGCGTRSPRATGARRARPTCARACRRCSTG